MTTCGHIVVIEDEPDLRDTVQELLELSGFSVSTAANGREALADIEELSRACLILLDLMMPVMNGWQFLEKIRTDYEKTLGNIPVVVISAAADLAEVQRQYGCRSLKKPVTMDQLVSVASEYCGG